MEEVKITPMLKQYLDIKQQYQDHLLLYRMGDFYELFFEDAKVAAPVLEIALTRKSSKSEEQIPMCGVPHHSADIYIAKLVKEGYKIAICDQLETPEEAKKRGYKAVIKRDVTRIITKGTLTEDNLLEGGDSNYLCSISESYGNMAISWADISTGEFYTISSSYGTIVSDIASVNPSEIIISDRLYQDFKLSDFIKANKKSITSMVDNFFDHKKAERKIREFYNIHSFESFGKLEHEHICACGALIEYISITQKQNKPRLLPPKLLTKSNYMAIDAATRRNLELTKTASGNRKGSLLGVIDRTRTPMGRRLLAKHMATPLLSPELIDKRLDAVEFFLNNSELRKQIRDLLVEVTDIERATARVIMGRASPRDLQLIMQGLEASTSLFEIMCYGGYELSGAVDYAAKMLKDFSKITGELRFALKEELPQLARDGGIINPLYHPKLQELHDFKNNSNNIINGLREKYRKETGVANLKLTRNNVLGYYIEVSPQNAAKLDSDMFIHRQTLASSVRFTSKELQEVEANLLSINDNILRLELELYNSLLDNIKQISEDIYNASTALSIIDVTSSHAETAIENNYVRPVIDNSSNLHIIGGRHPVVEHALRKETDKQFIPNNAKFEENERICLLTGPNMAGKSTYLRQNAQLIIMAQIGSFVPAEQANIGVVDRLFSRIGAGDDLAKGESTFMVEMIETATILNQATERSFVILDEIGRGTATFDGMSIAWAVVEYLHNKIGCRTIFATHYHELTKLSKSLPALKCYYSMVSEWAGKIIFMHEIAEGTADKSYGIYVAKLAGIPHEVVNRAQSILENIEEGSDLVKQVEKLEAI